MRIDISGDPPENIFRDRGKYIWLSSVAMAVVLAGIGMGAYAIFTNTPHRDRLEKIVLPVFGVGSVFFAYFCSRLQVYKGLNSRQKSDLARWCSEHEEIAVYCDKVAAQGRRPVHAEYEACEARVDDITLAGSGE